MLGFIFWIYNSNDSHIRLLKSFCKGYTNNLVNFMHEVKFWVFHITIGIIVMTRQRHLDSIL